MQKRVLLIGGTGLIGERIQTIAADRLRNTTLFIGSRKKGADNRLVVDVNNPDSLDVIKRERIDLVVLCTIDRMNNVLKFCIRHKIDFIDITKPTESLKNACELAKHEEINSRIVFSSGWMGGIIPSLVSYNNDIMKTKEIGIYIYYSLKDKAGKSSADFMAENVSKAFPVYKNDKPMLVRHFEGREKYEFIFNPKRFDVYYFDIPDVYILNHVENIPNVSAKITYSSAAVTNVLAIMQKLNIFRRMSLGFRKKIFYSSGDGDLTAFEVVAKLEGKNDQRIGFMCGAGQAYLTALSTCLHIERILKGRLPERLYISHQLYDGQKFINNIMKDEHIKIDFK